VSLEAEGSLARIYRARPADSSTDCAASYAVKMLRPGWEDRPEAVALLQREAEVGRTVSHPHLVPILGASIGRSPRYLVTPWLEGTTLEASWASGSRVDVPRVLWIARQVAEAMQALYAAGWMHGDIKPGNIFLSPEGHATLLDLGFARRNRETGSTADRCVTGTYNYMAPEQTTRRLRADIRSDIYGLGVVLFELLSGRLPFRSTVAPELAAQHKRAVPPDLARLAPHLPSPVVRLVHQMLAKEPLRRPFPPKELIERLAALEIELFAQRL
jgi:serine/threonine protein kinase